MKAWIIMAVLAVTVFIGSVALAQHYCGGIVAIVSATPTPPPGSFPQFNTNGTLGTAYSSSTSVFPMSMFILSPQDGFPPTALSTSGISVYESANLWPYINIPPNTFGGCGANGTFSTSCFKTAWNNLLTNSYQAQFKKDGIPYLIRSDNVDGGGYIGNTPANIQTQMPTTAAAMFYVSQQLQSEASANHDIIGQISIDEVNDCQTPCSMGTVLDGFGLAFKGDNGSRSVTIAGCNGNVFTCGNPPSDFTPNAGPTPGFTNAGFTHLPYGAEPQRLLAPYWWTLSTNGTNPSVASDYIVFENTGGRALTFGASNTANRLSENKAFDVQRNSFTGTAATEPIYMSIPTQGVSYGSNHTGAPYNYIPGTDPAFRANTDDGEMGGPGVIIDDIFYAVAHGYAGVRSYFYDFNGGQGGRCANRFSETANLAEQYTGTGPVEDWNNHHCAGQDRWYGQAESFNLIKILAPYILQPSTTAPTTTPACDHDGTTSAATTVVCGAKSGNGGRTVFLINFSDSSQSVTFDPTPYYSGATTSNEYQLIGGNDRGCGSQLSAYAATANGGAPYDCVRGETMVNGANGPLIGTGFSSPGIAPTTSACGTKFWTGTFSSPKCTHSMAALEVDVFNYHS